MSEASRRDREVEREAGGGQCWQRGGRRHRHYLRHHRRHPHYHLHHQGTLVWRVAGVEARMREARSSQGLELVGVITMMMVIKWSVMMVTLVTIVTTA